MLVRDVITWQEDERRRKVLQKIMQQLARVIQGIRLVIPVGTIEQLVEMINGAGLA